MTHPLSPTTALPALVTLYTWNAARIGEALRALRDVYFPIPSSTAMGTVPALKQLLTEAVPALRPKRTAFLARQDNVPDSGYASAEEDDKDEQEDETRDKEEMEDEAEDLEILRSDAFERGYAIKWLTGLVKRGDDWVCGTNPSSPSEQGARSECLDDATRLVARFAGDDAPEEALTRTFVFPFRMPTCGRCRRWDDSSLAPPIAVKLNDAPVDGTDHTAVGLQSWGSAIVFARRMCSDPERYLGALHHCIITATEEDTKTTSRRPRLLELGAGTGLLSITAAEIFSRTSVQARVKATDYHPSVLENLSWNVRDNHSSVQITVEKLDWCAVPCAEGGVGVYDVVLAADVVYHPEHASSIRGCVERTLKKGGVFWLIIPVRTIGRHEGLVETVETAFPVAFEGVSDGKLAIVRREKVERVDGVGRADEGGYTLFEIRWA